MKRLVAGVIVAGVLTVANSIPTSLTHAGSSEPTQQAPASVAPSPSDIVATARAYLGSPYAYIGNSPTTGFSCIGFVNFVFHRNGVYVPFDIPMAWTSAPRVAANDLMPGDILFYSNTVFAGLSHVAIYIGNDEMIGADSFAVGVTTDRVSDSYWQEHYTGATRPLALLGTAPMPGTGGASQSAATATPEPTAPPVIADAPTGSQLQPLSNAVGMYSGPGYQYTPVSTVSTEQTLTVVQAQGSWYDVRAANLYGWINAEDVRQIAQRQAAQPTATPTDNFSRASATTPASVLYVARGPLYVRSAPQKGNDVIGFVLQGTRLSVRQLGRDWAQVTTPSGQTGWVMLQYLSTSMPVPATPASMTSASGTTGGPAMLAKVIAKVLNVRALPSTHAQVITVLFEGERVQVIAQRPGWNQIKLRSGTIGWASALWLSFK